MSRTSIASIIFIVVVLAACGAPPAPSTSATVPPSVAPGPIAGGNDALDRIKAIGVIRISTDANYAPQSFFDPVAKQWKGFDVEVANELGKRLGVKVEFVTPDWSVVTAGNWSDRWDASVGSMAITPERAQALDFTPPYYYAPAQFAIRADLKDSIKTVNDLAGKTVCVAQATTYEHYLDGTLNLPNMAPAPKAATLSVVKTDADCVQSMQSGRKDYDAVLTSWSVVDEGIKKGAPILSLGTPPYYEELAIAVDKDATPNDRLLAALSDTVKAMHADGTLTNLSVKYYGFDLTRPAR